MSEVERNRTRMEKFQAFALDASIVLIVFSVGSIAIGFFFGT